jgi:1-phosphatidylinositol-3-phosphate 5-kinase
MNAMEYESHFSFEQVEELDTPFLGENDRDDREDVTVDEVDDEADKPIVTWTYCKNCRRNVSSPVLISEQTWKWSFGKFLEVFFYNRDGVLRECGCPLQSSVLYYGCDSLAARFTYEPVKPYGVFVRKTLPIVLEWHRQEAMRRLDVISMASSELFVKFDKHIEIVSREARSLFNSANNRPEHLQTVLSELNRIGSEVDLAAKTLQEKIASVSDSCRKSDEVQSVLRFPGLAKRYLFMVMSAWNEKLTATGQAMSAMKKLAGVVGTNPGDPLQEELLEGMRRLKELNEQYARYDVIDINQILPNIPNPNVFDDDDDFDDQPESSIDFTVGVDADVLASRRRLQKAAKGSVQSTNEGGRSSSKAAPKKTLGTRRQGDDFANSLETNIPPKSTPGGAVKSAITRFFNRGGREYESYRVDLGIFSEGRPRLAPGVNGIIVPVIDEQLSTIIAYSLLSSEYAKQFKHFSKFEGDADDVHAAQSHRQQQSDPSGAPSLEGTLPSTTRSSTLNESTRAIERKMLNRKKSHIKITFRDYDEKGRVTCKFVCTSYWATQFHAVREVFLSRNGDDGDREDIERSYMESLSSAYSWAASGGKSGASFARTNDDRFVMKNISRTELQMFLECSTAYFEYLSKAFFHGL